MAGIHLKFGDSSYSEIVAPYFLRGSQYTKASDYIECKSQHSLVSKKRHNFLLEYFSPLL